MAAVTPESKVRPSQEHLYEQPTHVCLVVEYGHGECDGSTAIALSPLPCTVAIYAIIMVLIESQAVCGTIEM